MSPEFQFKTCLCMEIFYFWDWELPMEEANCFGSRRSTMPIQRTLHSSDSLALVKTTTQNCMTWGDIVHKRKIYELSFQCHARNWIRCPASLASLAKEPFGPTAHIPVQSCKHQGLHKTHMTLVKFSSRKLHAWTSKVTNWNELGHRHSTLAAGSQSSHVTAWNISCTL